MMMRVAFSIVGPAVLAAGIAVVPSVNGAGFGQGGGYPPAGQGKAMDMRPMPPYGTNPTFGAGAYGQPPADGYRYVPQGGRETSKSAPPAMPPQGSYGARSGYGGPAGGGYAPAPGYGGYGSGYGIPGGGYGPGYGGGYGPQYGGVPGYGGGNGLQYGGYGPGYGGGYGPQYGGYGPGYGGGYGPEYGGPGYAPQYGPESGEDGSKKGGGFNPMNMMKAPFNMFGGKKD